MCNVAFFFFFFSSLLILNQWCPEDFPGFDIHIVNRYIDANTDVAKKQIETSKGSDSRYMLNYFLLKRLNKENSYLYKCYKFLRLPKIALKLQR